MAAVRSAAVICGPCAHGGRTACCEKASECLREGPAKAHGRIGRVNRYNHKIHSTRLARGIRPRNRLDHSAVGRSKKFAWKEFRFATDNRKNQRRGTNSITACGDERSKDPGPASRENCEGHTNPRSAAESKKKDSAQSCQGSVAGSGTSRERETAANDPAEPV